MKTKIKRIWWTVYEVSYRQPVWKLTINRRLCSRQFVISAIRRNRMSKSLEMRACLKLNSNVSKKLVRSADGRKDEFVAAVRRR